MLTINGKASAKHIYRKYSFWNLCRAVAQLGRASEPTTKVIGGDAVDACQRWTLSQPAKRTDTGVSQESLREALSSANSNPARPTTFPSGSKPFQC